VKISGRPLGDPYRHSQVKKNPFFFF